MIWIVNGLDNIECIDSMNSMYITNNRDSINSMQILETIGKIVN